MSNLAKLDFVALDISGKNYLQWVLDAEIHLAANGLGETIKEKNTATDQEKAKAMIFLRHHLNEGLKYEYMTVKDPLTLWTNLKERLQDFKSISDYNSAMYGITSQLALCGEKVSDADMLEKTYQTFHGSQLLMSQQYRQRANAIKYDHKDKGPDHASSRGRSHGYRGGRGNNFGNYRGGRGGQFKRSYSHQKWGQNNGPRDKDKMNADNFCNRCGCKGHWSRTCRTRKHFMDLYQQSLKDKSEKKIEANFTVENDKIETNFADGKDNYGGFLDVSDFFSDPDGRIDHLIGDGSV
ncbi:hypothetical protein RND81_10G068100 [Saponaria officinalis]|uniref:CCHC-type domain-containing protein n=1 Tax=Saponaria officinalis TaxID=3572 RepID=A0AAW1I169_SAPOF